jgi:hypothetical protein
MYNTATHEQISFLKGVKAMPEWEYTRLYVTKVWDKAKELYVWQFNYDGTTYSWNDENRIMNLMGEQEWELVCSVPITYIGDGDAGSYTGMYILYFKRPQPSPFDFE